VVSTATQEVSEQQQTQADGAASGLSLNQ